MSLLITNKKTLGDVALITISNKNSNLSSTTNGDLTIIKSEEEVVGLNVQNFSKYFKAIDGAHTINEEQLAAVEKLGYKIEDPSSKFLVAEVISREPHPKSERLFILKVKTDKELTIVTNTLYSTVGVKIVVATVGATLPSGLAIGRTKMMGVVSEGTLCGSETLGKGKSEGILIPNGNVGDKYIL